MPLQTLPNPRVRWPNGLVPSFRFGPGIARIFWWIPCFPETHIFAQENWMVGRWNFLLGWPMFMSELSVSGRVRIEDYEWQTKLELFMIISLREWKTINLDKIFFWLRGCILASTSIAFLAVNWLARSMPMGDRGITPVAGWVGKHRRIVVCPDSSFICVYDIINDMLCHAVRSPCKIGVWFVKLFMCSGVLSGYMPPCPRFRW